MEALEENFVNNGDVSSDNFNNKIQKQLEKVKPEAIELTTNLIWLWRLPVESLDKFNVVEDFKKIKEFNTKLQGMNYDKNFTNFKGFATAGQGYNGNKAFELAYLIKFFKEFLSSHDDKKEKAAIEILKKLDGKSKIIEQNGKEVEKTAFIHNALLHLFCPKNYVPILSNNHKEKIKNTFFKIFKENNKIKNLVEQDDDLIIIEIEKYLKSMEELNKDIKNYKGNIFYHPNIKNIWYGGIDFESKNIILHGAPGTGKTYSALESIRVRKAIGEDLEYMLVQFHPSYGYEEFIDGIKPVNTKAGSVNLELVNGKFKEFCREAFKNLIEAKNDKTKLKKFYFVADEINRTELSRVFGEVLLCLEDDKRLKFENKELKGEMLKTANSELWTKENHAVVWCDSDGKIVDKENTNTQNDNVKKIEGYFGIPENLYFIGTMNDIDRSVDSFDMALRRKFTWVHYSCDYEVISEKFSDDKNIEKYLKICANLNEFIGKKLGLGSDYEIGHSYFMKLDKIDNKKIERLWERHLKPLLREYLRSQYSKDDIDQKLKDTEAIFTLSNDKQ